MSENLHHQVRALALLIKDSLGLMFRAPKLRLPNTLNSEIHVFIWFNWVGGPFPKPEPLHPKAQAFSGTASRCSRAVSCTSAWKFGATRFLGFKGVSGCQVLSCGFRMEILGFRVQGFAATCCALKRFNKSRERSSGAATQKSICAKMKFRV